MQEQQQQQQDIVFNASSEIVFNASEEAQVSKRRVVEQRIRDRFRGTSEKKQITSPRLMTINIPAGPSAETEKRDRSTWHPPQEILVGLPGEEEGKPPQTIEVKGLGSFFPPKQIVVVEPKEDTGRVPDVIQISDVVPDGQKAAAQRSLSGTEVAVRGAKSHMKRKATAKQRRRSDTHQDVGKNPPQDIEVRKELPSVGDEIAVIIQPESTIRRSQEEPRQVVGMNTSNYHNSVERRRHSAQDPPAAKAATTNRHVLPDFSSLAATNNNNISNRRRNHRKNILDFSDDKNHILHQSWPVQGGTTEMIATNLSKANRARVPQWLGVTGTPEDWIRPDNPRQIGRKIASQRMEI